MNFDLNEEQRLLADSTRRLLADAYGFEARKGIVASDEGFSPAIWRQLSELGLLALPVPTEHDGFGGGAVDLAPAMEAFGDALLVEPFLATVMCARMLAKSAD